MKGQAFLGAGMALPDALLEAAVVIGLGGTVSLDGVSCAGRVGSGG